ncbi:MAG: AAA family ATPase, partial [Lachnospiraceae bacterium]|nr:AAA family ATPase [Lachnospiraceae bacterium]
QYMIATHKVKTGDQKTIGFMIDDVFYTNYYIRQYIQDIDNLSLQENGMPEAEKELPELDYKKVFIDKEYEKLVTENPFVRDVQDELLAWKEDKLHQVLQLEGTRQVGKTTELLKFAYKNYEFVIYVSLAADSYDFQEVVRNGSTPLAFESYCRRAGLPSFANGKNTILIIDEIQLSQKVYNAIRTLNRNVNCDIIVTGSYLGQTIMGGYFLPAGTVSYVKMYPLSFAEFCRIYDKDSLLEKIDLFGASEQSEYDALFALYDIYRRIGGYPAVIKKYVESGNYHECYQVIADLLNTFEKESRNYFQTSKEPIIFKSVYREAMIAMCRERKGSGNKIVELVTNIVKSSEKLLVSRDEISNAKTWLIYSGIIGECGCYIDGDIMAYRPARRLYYMDCGIAGYIGADTEVEQGNIEGVLTETFVFAELYRLFTERFSKSKVKGDTPCFSIIGQNELDFMLFDRENRSYGIEVKTNDGAPKSLRVYMD